MSAIANQAKSTFYRGQTGPQGPRGPQGEKGDRGDRGDRGANGAQGVGILDATVDANGYLTVTLEDATVIRSQYSIIGPQGIQGIQGIQGVSVTSAVVSDGGRLLVTLSSGITVDVGYVVGPRGPTGATGPQGNPGVITTINNKSAVSVTLTTADISESENLYYTDQRFDNKLATKTTSNLTEGTNQYFTTTRVRQAVSASGDLSYDPVTGVFSYTTPALNYDELTGLPALATVALTGSYNDLIDTPTIPSTTTQIAEGTNLYFTDARAKAAVTTITGNAGTATKLATARTIAGVSFDGSANITLSTSNITEGTNKYYTDAKVDARISSADSTKSTTLVQFGAVKLGDHLSVTGSAGVMAWHVADGKPVYHNGTAWFFMDGTPA